MWEQKSEQVPPPTSSSGAVGMSKSQRRRGSLTGIPPPPRQCQCLAVFCLSLGFHHQGCCRSSLTFCRTRRAHQTHTHTHIQAETQRERSKRSSIPFPNTAAIACEMATGTRVVEDPFVALHSTPSSFLLCWKRQRRKEGYRLFYICILYDHVNIFRVCWIVVFVAAVLFFYFYPVLEPTYINIYQHEQCMKEEPHNAFWIWL